MREFEAQNAGNGKRSKKYGGQSGQLKIKQKTCIKKAFIIQNCLTQYDAKYFLNFSLNK